MDVKTMEKDLKFYNQDLVAMLQKSGVVKYGFVMAGNSGAMSEFQGNLKDLITVKWYPSNKYECIPANKVVLMDRKLTAGDRIHKIDSASNSQFGYCDSVKIYTTLKIKNTNKIIEKVEHRSLYNINKFLPTSWVRYDNWIGQINETTVEVVFVTRDGSIFMINAPTYGVFNDKNVEVMYRNGVDNEFYPGQKMHINIIALINANYLKLTKVLEHKLKNRADTIKSIEVYVKENIIKSVDVGWEFQVSVNSGKLVELDIPKRTLAGKNLSKLILLDLFNEVAVDIGDMYLYKIKETDNIKTMKLWHKKSFTDYLFAKKDKSILSKTTMKKKLLIWKKANKKHAMKLNMLKSKLYKWKKGPNSMHTLYMMKNNYLLKSNLKRKKFVKPMKMCTKPNSIVVAEVINIKTWVNVLWQDGTKEFDLPATNFQVASNALSHEFFPGNFVDGKQKNSPTTYGVIENVDYLTRIACVNWFDNPNPEFSSKPIFKEKSSHSVYDLVLHKDFAFDNGQMILHMAKIDGESNCIEFNIASLLRVEPDGFITLKLTNGDIIKAYPHNLYDPHNDDLKEFFEENEVMHSSQFPYISNVKTTVTDALPTPPMVLNVDVLSQTSKPIIEIGTANNSKLNVDLILYLNGSAENVLQPGSINENKISYELPLGNITNNGQSNIDIKFDENSKIGQEPIEYRSESTELKNKKEDNVLTKSEEIGVFKILESSSSIMHKFISNEFIAHKQILRVINKEVKLLQNNLPAGIWVKTFENRMDLYSVMIRGPENTPYANGLYLFDIILPPSYPDMPPSCHYYSFCEDRLNPNLYPEGKVCLSLLGTWNGLDNENWSPKYSNLLQLIVSIQGLILVNEPYFNEPGFTSMLSTSVSKEKSRVYNELVLINVVKSMTNLLARYMSPGSGNFTVEILEHFQYHGPKIVTTIENWIQVSKNDQGNENGESNKLNIGFPLLPLSVGFCVSMTNILNKFKTKLSEILPQ